VHAAEKAKLLIRRGAAVKEKKIIIIGAGIAGLTAAYYAQKNCYVEQFLFHKKEESI